LPGAVNNSHLFKSPLAKLDVQYPNFLGSEFGTKFKMEIPLFFMLMMLKHSVG